MVDLAPSQGHSGAEHARTCAEARDRVTELVEFFRTHVWPKGRGENNAWYQKKKRLEKQYVEALDAGVPGEFTLGDMFLLSPVINTGPADHVLGPDMLGKIETI